MSSLFDPSSISEGNTLLPISIIFSILLFYTARYINSPYRKLPPGPRGYPIIGNILDIQSKPWFRFTEWRKQYGDLIYLNVAGQPTIVLNSHKVATDLLELRAAIYSDRPRYIVASDIMTGGLFIVFSPYGEVWRRMRRAVYEALNKDAAAKDFHEVQTTEAVLLACDGLAEPGKWDRHLRRAAASMILSTVYDHPTVRSEQDPVVKLINEFGQRVGCAAYPGAHLVELFPWMRHIPSRFAKWKRDAETWYKKDSAMFEGLFNTVKSRIEEGDNRPSLTATLIRDVEGHKLSMREAAWSAENLYNGGADTTAATMAWWTIAILAYPETQARAHAELDQVVGRARLPTFADYPRLPYIRAMVKEALHWRPVGPIGMPHQSVEDDWYEGIFIPKGAICIVNMWHLNRDPEVHGKDATHFNPSRHLDGKGDVAPGPREAKEGHITYGFGRRACVARRVANNSVFIDIAMVLWASKIERKKDWSLDVDGCDDHGLVVRPVPFECSITPRFPESLDLLARERKLRGL